jgi:branched-chain amino acid aminotransferase
MLDPQGYVAECSGENLFLVRGGVIFTPPRAAVLEGITRDTLITLAADLGYSVVEENISRDQLYLADEVFVTGTAAEVVAVTAIDYRPVGAGRMGPISRELQQLYFETVRGKGKRSPQWLDYTVGEPLY